MMAFLPSGENRAGQVHLPDFTTTEEGDGLVIEPLGIGLVLGILGQLLLLAAVGIHHPKHLMALVLLYTVITHLENNVFAVGGSLIAANTTHGPKRLGRHQVAFKLNCLLLYVDLVGFFLSAASH